MELINNNNILKTWYPNFAQPAGLSVQFAFHAFLLAWDTDSSTSTTGRAHDSQLI